MIKEKPKTIYCYTIPTFSEGRICPHLDDSVALKPLCLKYATGLHWARSGITLKCDKCLRDE